MELRTALPEAADPFAAAWPLGWPPLHLVVDEHIEPAVRAAVDARAAALEAVSTAEHPPAFGDVVNIERAHALLWPVRQLWSVLLKTAGTPARHALDAVVTPLLAAADAAAWLDPRLYARVAAVHARRAELDLDQEDTALLDRVHRRFVRVGAHLDDGARDRLRTLTAHEAELEVAIEARLSAGLAAAAVHVTDRAELAGLDDNEVAAAAAAAAERDQDGWLLTLSAPTVQPILARLADPGLRRRVHAASVSRCSRGDAHDTRHLAVELYRLRATRARLLGYAHHADYVLAEQTAGSSEAVATLLHELAPLAVRQAAAEDTALTTGSGPVAAADRLFLADQARRGADVADVREYLPLSAVLDGVRQLVHRLYGMQLRERLDLPVHAPGVLTWEAVDHDGRRLGLVLADLHRRPGKRPGAWCTELSAQSRLLDQRAVVCLSLNLPPHPDSALNSGDVLLTADEAVTVFHEVGHVVHVMLSDVRYPGDSGFSRLPRDVVEAPSVVQEMWALDPGLLAGYARHHVTGAPMPADLAAALTTTRHGVGYRLVEDIATALLDLAWHSIGPDDEIGDVEAFEHQVLTAAGLADTVPPRYLTAFFRHSLVGGYDASYYAYSWSDALAAQLHEAFTALGGPGRAAGDALREVLARGGTDPGLYLALVGGQLRTGPFLARLGITG
ncbi:M3 family metallopeptidase (plasmid) [Lentzea sp. JNUCC 0626]|uniref:M3 family metallopeptidase n=1 Tax=Lentzea sp. JNUCC 0626 TaxID=3367513 RepID=UPI003749B421